MALLLMFTVLTAAIVGTRNSKKNVLLYIAAVWILIMSKKTEKQRHIPSRPHQTETTVRCIQP